MKKRAWGRAAVLVLCALLTVSVFFAKDLVLFDFHMNVSDYTYLETGEPRPAQAATSLWFSYGDKGRELWHGVVDPALAEGKRLYALSGAEVVALEAEPSGALPADWNGNLIASLPAQRLDADGDGVVETVYDFARADFGPTAFLPVPQIFGSPDIPFELVFAERKYVLAYYQGQLLTGAEVTVTSAGGEQRVYSIGQHGWIDGLPIRDIHQGFTASYSPDGETVYRMYYALEGYDYFTPHFFAAFLPLLLVFGLSGLGIALVQLLRNRLAKKDPAYAIYSRERVGVYRTSSHAGKTGSKYLLVRWLCLLAATFLWAHFGKLIGQPQALNELAIPVLSCPFNLDQVVEVPCYYLAHLPDLFHRFGPDFPARNLFYAGVYLASLALCFVFLGRILCGFLCPAGLLQDLMDRLRQLLHIRPITVTDRMYRILQPLKWVWIILFLGVAFVGLDFCNACPLKVFATAQGGFWTNLNLNGIFAVVLLVGSFFIKRFWCLMCPMGYLMGIFHRFNLFKLKKDCTACTECGACYEACPMRLKNIYTERETEAVQTVDCLMCGECVYQCPETDALRMTFCGKTIYRSSRKAFLSRYEGVDKQDSREEQEVKRP